MGEGSRRRGTGVYVARSRGRGHGYLAPDVEEVYLLYHGANYARLGQHGSIRHLHSRGTVAYRTIQPCHIHAEVWHASVLRLCPLCVDGCP